MDGDRGPSAGLLAGIVAVLLAAGGGAWFLFAGRGATEVDSGGFDLSAAPKSAAPAATASPAPAAAPKSGLEMLAVDARTRAELGAPAPARPTAAPPAAPPPAAKPGPRDAAEARVRFTEAARRHETKVRDFAMRMTARSPVVAQYGRDWMSQPDLKKLNDDFMRDHDPVKFMLGLSRAPSFPVLLRKYARSPELASFVVLGVTQEAPRDLAEAGLDLVRLDPAVREPVTKVADGLGLPPELSVRLGGTPPKR